MTPKEVIVPIALRLKPGRIPVRMTGTVSKTKPAPEERWWFPLGSITRAGEGIFRWHCVGTVPESGKSFIFSGRLDVHDDVGHLLDEDMDEGDVDEDPSQSWYDRLPPFPYCHYFYDACMDYPDVDLGPWFCIHAVYGKNRFTVEMNCLTSRR